MFPVVFPLILSVILFSLGIVGVLIRKNAIIILMSLELMFNAANLAFITFANHFQSVDGQVFVIFVMVTAAAEAAVGLVLIVSIFRLKKTVNIDDLHSLKG